MREIHMDIDIRDYLENKDLYDYLNIYLIELNKHIEIAKKQPSHNNIVAFYYYFVGNAYRELRYYDVTFEYYNKAQMLAESMPSDPLCQSIIEFLSYKRL